MTEAADSTKPTGDADGDRTAETKLEETKLEETGLEKQPPLRLKRGIRIQLGHRTGKVAQLRGPGPNPYDVLVAWDEDKYPQWLVFVSLEREYERGDLKLL